MHIIGRKPVLLLGVGLYTTATLLFLTTTDPWWFVLFRFLEGMGAAAVFERARIESPAVAKRTTGKANHFLNIEISFLINIC